MNRYMKGMNRAVVKTDRETRNDLAGLLRTDDPSGVRGLDDMALIRRLWYGIFDRGILDGEKEKKYEEMMGIFRRYGAEDCRSVLLSACSSYNARGVEDSVRDIGIMLSRIQMKRQLVVPVMAGGFVPGAFVCDYLGSHGKLIDVAFLGYSRQCEDYNFKTEYPGYEPRKVYMFKPDAEKIRRNPSRIIVVDDVKETGSTIAAVSDALRGLGVERFDTAFVDERR